MIVQNYGPAQTAAEKIIALITTQYQPQLSDLLAKLLLMQRAWQANDITGKIEQAVTEQKLLAGYNPQDFGTLGVAFNLLIAFITTPMQELGGKSIEDILLTTYVPQEGESL